MQKSVLVSSLVFLAVAGMVFAKNPPPPIPVNNGPQPSVIRPVLVGNPELAAIRAEQQAAFARGDEAGARALETKVQALLLKERGAQPQVRQPVAVPEPPKQSGSFAPDNLIYEGDVYAIATDYEQDANGTMWVAASQASDTTVGIWRSEDHGVTWTWFNGFYWPPRAFAYKLELAVGKGDSNFVYCWSVHPNNNGELLLTRFNHDGSGLVGFAVDAGPDTVTDFAACRDNFNWLYAVSYHGNGTTMPMGMVCRSVDWGQTWATIDSIFNCDRPFLSAGPGPHLYLSTIPNAYWWKGWVALLVNRSWGTPGGWESHSFQDDTFEVYDAAVGAAFTSPDSEATVWTAYSHRYEGSDDWDVLYVYSTDGGTNWSTVQTLAFTTAVEAYVDVRNYTSAGNTYINASYLTPYGYTGPVYLTYANAPDPTNWATPYQVNQTVEGYYGISTRPRIVYSPNGPGPGGGCVWVGPASHNVYFNASWLGAVAEKPGLKRTETGFSVSPSPAANAARFAWAGAATGLQVFDRSGRLVRGFTAPAGNSLVWNRTDAEGRSVAAGVYLARLTTANGVRTRTVVLQ